MTIEIPAGLDHLRMLTALSEQIRQSSEADYVKHSHGLRIIGTSLSALYQVRLGDGRHVVLLDGRRRRCKRIITTRLGGLRRS